MAERTRSTVWDDIQGLVGSAVSAPADILGSVVQQPGLRSLANTLGPAYAAGQGRPELAMQMRARQREQQKQAALTKSMEEAYPGGSGFSPYDMKSANHFRILAGRAGYGFMEAMQMLEQVGKAMAPPTTSYAPVQIQTANGPMWVNREDAIGQSPVVKPTPPPTSHAPVKVMNPDGTFTWRSRAESMGLPAPAAGGQNINVNTVSQHPGLDEWNKRGVDALVDAQQERIEDAHSLGRLSEAFVLLDSGKVMGGPGSAPLTKFLAFTGQRLGWDLGDPESVDVTNSFTGVMGGETGAIIKLFGSGTGLSDADREFANNIVGNPSAQTPQAIRRLMEINQRWRRIKISEYNKQATKFIESQGGLKGLAFDPRVPIPGMGGVFIIDDVPLTMKDKDGNTVETTYGSLLSVGARSLRGSAASSAPNPATTSVIPGFEPSGDTVTFDGVVYEVGK